MPVCRATLRLPVVWQPTTGQDYRTPVAHSAALPVLPPETAAADVLRIQLDTAADVPVPVGILGMRFLWWWVG